MTLVAFSPPRLGLQQDLQPFERLAIRLSLSSNTVEAGDVDRALALALEDVGTAFGVEECTLIAFGERGRATVVQSWAAQPHTPCGDEDVDEMPWLVRQLARNEVVTMTPSTEMPHAAATDCEHAERTGVVARLAVPVALGAHVAYGLILGSRQRHSGWGAAVVERLRLVGEILASGLDRRRHVEALNAAPASAERPVTDARTAPVQADVSKEWEVDHRIIGDSAALRLALAHLDQVASLDATVLLLGETGTGKELFARALHDRSRRRERTLMRVNCAALPASLIESELFGHERGAFTGAVAMRQGRFELADGGTIFLDEIGDLAPELQAKLLRVLQEGEFERVGSSKTRRVDVRVIAATHRDLERGVAEGRFRADLYYRLGVFPIALPPLRERPEDIPQLVWFFIHRHQRRLHRQIKQVPASVMQVLQRHDWPGNIRELENVIERAMIRTSGDTLELTEQLRADTRIPPARDCGDTLDAVQRFHIERVLRECGWRINGIGNAAVRLGIHPNTLRFRIKKLGVVLPHKRADSPTSTSEARSG